MAVAAGTGTVTGDGGGSSSRPTHVSDAAMELLITEALRYVERSTPSREEATTGTTKTDGDNDKGNKEQKQQHQQQSATMIYAKEMAAAKMERMGYSVGYRLCERLSQNRTFSASGKDESMVAAAAQLEAVKFLCKEIWTEVFRKQIDKLQTNHRGVFVLKDHELRWLTRLPANQETARVAAIQLLAFPCTHVLFGRLDVWSISRSQFSSLPAVFALTCIVSAHFTIGF